MVFGGHDDIAVKCGFERLRLIVITLIVVAVLPASIYGANWPGWRNDGSGVSTECGLPIEWDAQRNVLWKTPIRGKGMSSPIIHGDRIFLTTAVASQDRESTRQWLWIALGTLATLITSGLLITCWSRDPAGAAEQSATRQNRFFRFVSRNIVALPVAVFMSGVVVTELLTNVEWSVGGEWVTGSITRIWLLSGTVVGCGAVSSLLMARRSLKTYVALGMMIAGVEFFFTVGVPDFRPYSAFPSRIVELLLFSFGVFLGTVSVQQFRRACLIGLVVYVPLLMLVAYLQVELDKSGIGFLRFRILLGIVSGLTMAVVTNRILVTLPDQGRRSDSPGPGRLIVQDVTCVLLLLMAGLQFYGCNFLLPSKGLTRRVVCLDANSGNILWDEGFFTPEEPIVTAQSLASPTPVTDGKRVYAYFGNAGAICLDYDGKIQWINDALPLHTKVGAGTSPVIFEDLLILACDHNGPSYVVALDTKTGKERWKSHRETPLSFGTPMLMTLDGRPQLVVAGGNLMAAYNPVDGNELWSTGIPTAEVVPSVVGSGGMLFVGGYWMGDKLSVYRAGGDCCRKGASRLWATRKNVLGYATPVVSDDYVYVVTNQGIASCLNTQNGKTEWRKRLSGNFSASPVLADNRVYFLSREGVTTVVEDAPDCRIVAKNAIEETCFASPAISNGRILLRSTCHVWCIGN